MNWWAPSSTGIHAIAMNSRRCRIWRTASTPIAQISKPPPMSASGEKHMRELRPRPVRQAGDGGPRPRSARLQAGQRIRAVDEGLGYVGQAAVAGPGGLTQQAEGLVHVQAEALGQLALGLLDDDPAVQRGLQLFVEGIAVAHVALLQQADRGHVGQGLADPDVRGVEDARSGPEEVQRADD